MYNFKTWTAPESSRSSTATFSRSFSYPCMSSGTVTFTLWKNDKFLASQGKKMDKTAAKKFLSKGKIHYKDLVSRKTGRQYEATVEMVDPGEGNVQFNLIFPQR